MGDTLRGRGDTPMSRIPIIALTATAPPNVQADMKKSLHLRNQYQFTGTFMRKNLHFEVRAKSGKGYDTDLQFLVKEVMKTKGNDYFKPTIIYVNTRKDVEAVRDYLERAVGTKTNILKYHGSLSKPDREFNHMAFLTGTITDPSNNHRKAASIIVATLAFGMGIDKPDVRNVIHWGAPRTVEAYYQQAGRAGRDGGVSRCLLIYSRQEFINFKTADFYKPKDKHTGVVNERQLAVFNQSTDALQAYCESQCCRQLSMIAYLGGAANTPKCGVCDSCLVSVRRDNGEDQSVDFQKEVHCILQVLEQFEGKAKGTVVNIMMGLDKVKVEPQLSSKKKRELYGNFTAGNRLSAKNKQVAQSFVEHMISSRLITSQNGSFNKGGYSGGFSVNFEILSLSSTGAQLLEVLKRSKPNTATDTAADTSIHYLIKQYCIFPPPRLLAQLMEERAKKAAELQEEINAMPSMQGVFIPPAELTAGEGPVLEAELKWARFIQRLVVKAERATEAGDEVIEDKVGAAEAVIDVLQKWRIGEGARLKLAPATILSDMLLKRIAYCIANGPVTTSLINTIGVRSGNIDELASKLKLWRVEVWGVDDESQEGGLSRLPIPTAWKNINYGQPCTSGKTLNESQRESLALFVSGKTFEEVGARKAKQVVANTVESHIMDALLSGAPQLLNSESSLERLFERLPSPAQCQEIQAAFSSSGTDWQDTKAPMRPVCDILGGDTSWYTKIKSYKVLLHLKYPFETVYSTSTSKSEETPPKRMKTE